MKKINKKHIFSYIIVPLLVTALWEKLFGPLVDTLLNWLSLFGSKIIQVILYWLYTRIATGRHVDAGLCAFMIIASYLLAEVLTLTQSGIKKSKQAVAMQKSLANLTDNTETETTEESSEDQEASLKSSVDNMVIKSKKLSRSLVIYTVFVYALYLTFVMCTNYINNTITKITNNIEIVAPYIEDSEYKLLKSAFYSMEGSDDYHSLINDLNNIAELHNVKLKK